MSVDSVLADGRAAAEALMSDVIEIRRGAGASGVDESTGRAVTGSSPVWSGPGKLQSGQALPVTGEVAGRMQTVQRYELHVPVAAVGIQVGDLARVTASTNPLLVGRTYRVAGQPQKTRATAQRLPSAPVIGDPSGARTAVTGVGSHCVPPENTVA